MAELLPEGWHEGVPMEDYLADPGVGSSDLREIRVTSPKKWRHSKLHPKPATTAMDEGTAVHMATLEPEEFDRHYVVLGQCAARKTSGEPCTNPGKFYRGPGKAYCGLKGHDPKKGAPMDPGIHAIQEDVRERILAGRAALLGHPLTKQFFRGEGSSEVTGIWIDPATGVRCKIRLDRRIGRVNLHTDLKWTENASPLSFPRHAGNMGWVERSAFYRRGMEHLGTPAEGSVIIALENQPPHDIAVYLLDEKDIAAYAARTDGLLSLIKQCQDTDTWPGYPPQLIPLKLKPWFLPPPKDDDFDDDFDDED